MTEAGINKTSAAPKRRRLLTLAAVILASFILCLWLFTAQVVLRGINQRAAVTAMRCAVQYESSAPRWLEDVIGKDLFGRVTMIYQDQMWFDDAHLSHVKHLPHVKRLFVPNTSITDGGLRSLSELAHLEELGLENTQVTDAGLVELKGLPSLARLILQKTNVTAAGVEDFQKAMPRCRIEWQPDKERR